MEFDQDDDQGPVSSSPGQQGEIPREPWPGSPGIPAHEHHSPGLNEFRTPPLDREPHRPVNPYRTTTRSFHSASLTPHASTSITSVFQPPTHPSSIFSFPTPTTYSAPPHPTQNLSPFATGSASELFKCVVKKPNVVQLEINDEMQSNERDVTVQFLAELRVYTTVTRHRNICAFLGALENVGMVIEYIDGRTLWDVIKDTERPLTRAKKIDYHNQLLDGLTHLHSFGLGHGDLSLLNIQVTWSSDTIKLVDFGRSVASDSVFASPDDDLSSPPYSSPPMTPRSPPVNSRFAQRQPTMPFMAPPPYAFQPTSNGRRIEQIHPGTRPFSAPEVLRGECTDPLLADAYGFGMVLACLDLQKHVDVPPWEQRKDKLPTDLLESLTIFRLQCERYLRKLDERCRVQKEDAIDPKHTEGEELNGDVEMDGQQ